MKKSPIIAIVGGRLQGIEACYLAKKAGYESLLIDKDANAPARGLCGAFSLLDVRRESDALRGALCRADMVLPCTENDEALDSLVRLSKKWGFALAFDPAAYAITKSKLRTDALMRERGIPAPRYYPEAPPPYILKPSGGSGSDGLRFFDSRLELERFLERNPGEWVAQELLDGPSYSIEIVGLPGCYRAYAVTRIHVDRSRDCCRVTAPCDIRPEQDEGFAELGIKLAELVNLHGIMDVEVIEQRGVFKVLELDARLPSQTPAVVLRASGVNLLSELYDIWKNGRFTSEYRRAPLPELRAAEYLNCLWDGERLVPAGEHIMAAAGALRYRENFMGYTEAMTDFGPGETGRGIFIR